MITKQDERIIKFIETFPCYSDTIQMMFYKSQRATNRRLTYLYEYGCIKRSREHASKKYFYWTGKGKREPSDRHKNHYNLVARAFIWVLKHDYNILNIEVQKQYGSVKPDLLLEIEKGGKSNILPIEVEKNDIDRTVRKYEDTEFHKLLLFSQRPFNKDTTIEVVNVKLLELK